MTQSSPTDSVIRITKGDAESQHVNDLLKRQASLRGETGITRDLGRRWYYQNWFVLSIAGLLCAVLGWAILRPVTRDFPYIQGKIEAVSPADPSASWELAEIKIGGQVYPVPRLARMKDEQGNWNRIEPDALKEGNTVGAYIEIPRDQKPPPGVMPIMIVAYLDPNPPATSNSSDIRDAISSQQLGFMALFPLVAGLVGLGIGAADGIMCRLPRRIFLAGFIGLIVGLFGGFVSHILAGLVYQPISDMALKHTGSGAGGLSTMGFLMQVMARSVGWTLAGATMGLGQGIALRSGKIIIYGLLGGLIGGLFGGLLFDPIDFMFRGESTPFAHLSRLVSLGVVGLSVGAMIGIVELLARDAWLRMVAGPLAGKEFLIFKNIMNVGASPKSDIYLFNDNGVAAQHATIRATGDLYEIEAIADTHMVTVNGRNVRRSRLRHGDQIGLGRTTFVFQRKSG